MCGIFAVHHYPGKIDLFLKTAVEHAQLLKHRGPDNFGSVTRNKSIFCHHRLVIYGIHSGKQPIISSDGKLILCVNGEVYNHEYLSQNFCKNSKFVSDSDCEVIMHLYEEFGSCVPNKLDAMFSFALYDSETDRLIVARDPIGVTTLYMGTNSNYKDTIYFASEVKAIQDLCDSVSFFPPGHVYDSLNGRIERYYEPTWLEPQNCKLNKVCYKSLRLKLEKAVKKRLMAQVEFGVLLSGGLDSSLIASLVVRENEKKLRQRKSSEFGESTDAYSINSTVKSFSIGLEGSPDLLAARKTANFLGTDHHEFTFTLEEGLDCLAKVIYHLETFDVTTIRASTPMYLLSKKINSLGIKMVLSGEGSDEIFGGYLYFASSPSAENFQQECIRRVKELHFFDNLRANKATMAWGLEARVPFLDKELLEEVLNIDPNEKIIKPGRIEKYILRKAFTVEEDEKPYLPDDILWRQKEQFSDGVGYEWIDFLKQNAAKNVTDEMMISLPAHWQHDTIETKEAYWYRQIFDTMFHPHVSETVKRWIPKTEWGCSSDPSGLSQKLHSNYGHF